MLQRWFSRAMFKGPFGEKRWCGGGGGRRRFVYMMCSIVVLLILEQCKGKVAFALFLGGGGGRSM